MNLSGLIRTQFDKLAGVSAMNMGSVIIFTSIAGWIASSAAQIIGIATNKNYTNAQKKFMITQESADAVVNILSYFAITKSLTALSSKMVSTAKLAPKSIINFLRKTNNLSQRGAWDFDVSLVEGFVGSSAENSYNMFKCFADSTAAIGGGIVASNIVTPILRNKVASMRHNQYIAEVQSRQAKPNTENVVINTKRHTFNDFRQGNLGMRI